ncbi:hypothetical protein [Paenarthrobacter sp. NPDC057981]|uniref:hypothetical protein n=1 Tax=Paenarthrobacter sp. NPDC057981 TaxID=3346297 RepID=UPI0036DF19EC
MGNESPFWEASIAVAPLLALTILVELRAIQWPQLRPSVRIVLASYMFSAVLLLSSSIAISLRILMNWRGDGDSDRTFEALVVLWSIFYALFGVMLTPLSLSIYAVAGPVAHPVYLIMRIGRTLRERRYKRHVQELHQMRQELRLEITERVIKNSGELFTPVDDSGRLQLADGRLAGLLKESSALRDSIERHEVSHRKWLKKFNRKLKKLRKHYPVNQVSDIFVLFSKESNGWLNKVFK